MESTTNLWQYIAVFAVLIIVFIWILVRLFSKKHRTKGGSCCGCALFDTCNDAAKNNRKKSKDDSCRNKR